MSLVVVTAPPAVGAQSQNLSVGLCLTGLKSGTCTTAIEDLSAFSLSVAPGSSGSKGTVLTATATMPVDTASVLLVNDVVTKAGLPTFVVEFSRLASVGTGLVFSYDFSHPDITSYLLQDAAGTGLSVQITFTGIFAVVYPSTGTKPTPTTIPKST
jgi:hypothetical protein